MLARKIKLSIAIPTYNRSRCLKRLILSIENQINDLDNIELLISDNCSSDDTFAVVNDLMKKYKNISYIRNGRNIGADRNFLQCYDKAKGEYVWLIGDDDLVLDGAIESIVKKLERNPDALFLNSSLLINQFISIHTRPQKNYIKKEFTNLSDFLAEISIMITYVSSMIVKTDRVAMCKDKEKYIDTLFIQSHIAILSMPVEGLFLINNDNCVAASPNRVIHYDLYEIWGKNYFDLLYITAKNHGVIREYIDKIYYDSLKNYISLFIMRFRMTCKDEAEWNKESFLPYANYFDELKDDFSEILYCKKIELLWKRVRVHLKRILSI